MEMLHSLLLSRGFEEELTELCKIKRKIPGMMILGRGQEAVGAGVCAVVDQLPILLQDRSGDDGALSAAKTWLPAYPAAFDQLGPAGRYGLFGHRWHERSPHIFRNPGADR